MITKIIVGLVSIIVVLCVVVYWLLWSSLPVLDGEGTLPGLSSEVVVARDAQGVATIRGVDREDVARATGFVHGQERFFQMDLLRRKAAGELAALLGPALYDVDVKHRMHGFRRLARQVILDSDQAPLIEAYTQGVNQGLSTLKQRPFEYLLLREEPKPWQAEDSVLVIYAMYLELQGMMYKQDALLGMLQQQVPPDMLAFLTQKGTSWDAALDDSRFPLAPIPAQSLEHGQEVSVKSVLSEQFLEGAQVGSNSWAVSGRLSSHGGGLIAGDMHLGLNVPNIWYRMKLEWQEQNEQYQVSGVSLPGLPYIVAGSNGYIAWAFTNSYADLVDLIELDETSLNKLEARTEIIQVKGEQAREEVFYWSRWGPVLDREFKDQNWALRWTAHRPDATNVELSQLEKARSVEIALTVAQQSGAPVQNFLVVDREGNLAWTFMGRLPKRLAHADSRFPIKESLLATHSHQWLALDDYPKVLNPEQGRLWSANARMLGGDEIEKIGHGGYALGARAKQIKEALSNASDFDEKAMLRLQLDDRAIFLERWHKVLASVLNEEAVSGNESRQKLKTHVLDWDGRASVESVSYRMVRAFRWFLAQRVFEMLLQPNPDEEVELSYLSFPQYEGPLWQLVESQPEHLLSEQYQSWQDLYLSVIDELIAYFDDQGVSLEEAQWGERNTLRMQHPIAMGLSVVKPFLNMPSAKLPGDIYMPRVQAPGFGASQRMVVSPGQEHLGYMHMPGGQSGHPLSPFYSAGHDDWVLGSESPFLPGETVYSLQLSP